LVDDDVAVDVIMNKYFTLSAAAVGAAVSAIYVVWPRPSPPPVSIAHTRGSIETNATITKDIAELRREMMELKRDHATGPVQAGAAPPRAGPAPASTAYTHEEMQSRVVDATRRLAERLEETLRGQYRDPKWSGITEGKIESVVKNTLTGALLDSIKCASTLCKVVVTHEDVQNQKELPHAIAREEPFATGVLYSYDGLVTTMYVLREGETLPDVSQ
jgi:hypothetical protein